METTPLRDDSIVTLLKKIVILSGGTVDCCGFETEQMLLFKWAQTACVICE